MSTEADYLRTFFGSLTAGTRQFLAIILAILIALGAAAGYGAYRHRQMCNGGQITWAEYAQRCGPIQWNGSGWERAN